MPPAQADDARPMQAKSTGGALPLPIIAMVAATAFDGPGWLFVGADCNPSASDRVWSSLAGNARAGGLCSVTQADPHRPAPRNRPHAHKDRPMTKPFSAIATATALFAAAISIVPAAAMAADAAVRVGDLDLSSDAGRAELSARVDRAAHAVCSSRISTGTILRSRVSQECLTDARRSIEQQIARRTEKSGLGG